MEETPPVDVLRVAAAEDALQPAPMGSSAAILLKARTKAIVPSLGRTLVPTGIRAIFPPQTFGYIAGRIALLTLFGLEVASGIVEEGFHGEIMVPVMNLGVNTGRIEKGEVIGSLIVVPYVPVVVKEETRLALVKAVEQEKKGHT